MAQRRYHARRGGGQYSEAAGAKPRSPGADERPLGSEPPSPSPPAENTKPEPGAKPEASFSTGLRQQLDDLRQQQRPDPLAQYLASIPGLSPHKFYFLHHYFSQNPQNLNPAHWDVLKAAHGIALDRGVKEDSPEYFGFLHALLHQHAVTPPTAAPAPPTAAPAPPMPAPPMPEPPTMQHADSAERQHSSEHDNEPDEDTHPMAHRVSAPPSHGDFGNALGDPDMRPGRITLTAEQRDIARRSMPHLPPGEAETIYADNVRRLAKQKKAGLRQD